MVPNKMCQKEVQRRKK